MCYINVHNDLFSRFGGVDRVIIYNEKQSDEVNDDDAEVIVKIFVEFTAMRGKLMIRCNN